LKPDDINEEVLNDRLYTAKIPDPDLLIRPGGEKRLSNFLLWQSAYTELWYTDVLWPDFKKEHIVEAIWIIRGETEDLEGYEVAKNQSDKRSSGSHSFDCGCMFGTDGS